jgi:hypothetical protein
MFSHLTIRICKNYIKWRERTRKTHFRPFCNARCTFDLSGTHLLNINANRYSPGITVNQYFYEFYNVFWNCPDSVVFLFMLSLTTYKRLTNILIFPFHLTNSSYGHVRHTQLQSAIRIKVTEWSRTIQINTKKCTDMTILHDKQPNMILFHVYRRTLQIIFTALFECMASPHCSDVPHSEGHSITFNLYGVCKYELLYL